MFDVVTLTVDLTEQNVWRGQVRTVVEILADVRVFEVEFRNNQSQTYELLG